MDQMGKICRGENSLTQLSRSAHSHPVDFIQRAACLAIVIILLDSLASGGAQAGVEVVISEQTHTLHGKIFSGIRDQNILTMFDMNALAADAGADHWNTL